jgi:hypothetical protein
MTAKPTRARATQRCAVVGLLLWAAACDRQAGQEPLGPTVIPTVGGQSGQEGSCAIDDVAELAFDVDSLRAAVVGRHETTLRWSEADRESVAGDERAGLSPALFEISPRGEPEVSLRCGGSAFLDVDVHMQVPDSKLDVTFEAVAQAWGPGQEVMVSTVFDRAFRSSVTGRAKLLADEALGTPQSSATEQYYFDLWLFAGHISGHLVGRNDSEFCGLAVWPEEYCDTHRIAMPVAEALGELDPESVFDAMRGIGEHALTWADGSDASIRFEIEPAEGFACTGPYFIRSPEEALDNIAIELPVRVRAITSDAALDVMLTGRLTALVSASKGWEGRVRMDLGASGRADAIAAGRPPLGAGDRSRSVSLEATRDPEGDTIRINVLEHTVPVEQIEARAQRSGAERELSCSAGSSAVAVDFVLEGSFGFEG